MHSLNRSIAVMNFGEWSIGHGHGGHGEHGGQDRTGQGGTGRDGTGRAKLTFKLDLQGNL